MKPARLPERKRKPRLTNGIACIGLFDHDGKRSLRNWLLRRRLAHSARKQNCSTDENASLQSQMIGAKHGIVTPSFQTNEPSLQHDNSGSENFKYAQPSVVGQFDVEAALRRHLAR